MRKHNEGYTLVLVLVVILVLTVCATAVLSFSAQNLKTQQRMVERMQDKYAAEGAIEAVMAQLDKIDIKEVESVSAREIIKAEVTEICDSTSTALDIEIKADFSTWPEDETEDNSSFEKTYTFPIIVQQENARISCEISIILKVECKTQTVANVTKKTYTFSEMKIELTSYEIGGAAS